MFSQILFAPKEINSPLSCYKVGLMGCVSIAEKSCPSCIEGITAASYVVSFEDGSSTEVVNTLAVFE